LGSPLHAGPATHPHAHPLFAPLKYSAMMQLLVIALAPAILFAARVQQAEVASSAANPIRKVVNLLQDMQAKVTAEGEKEEELYEKFMCYCKKNSGSLSSSLEVSNGKIDSLTSSVEGSTEKKAQAEQSLKDHQASRAEAKEAMATATAVREKEAAAYAEEEADAKANIAALAKAVAAIGKGMTGSFLQSSSASGLKRFVMEKAVLSDDARQDVLAFLSGSEGYVPRSGEITGILQQLKDEMSKGLEEAVAAEGSAIKTHEALMGAKKKEVALLTVQIEAESKRMGELGVEIASMSADLKDTKDSLSEDTQFLAQLKTGCETKTKEWEEVKATRADELVALAETIKVLNEDDSLELFKKTLPSASASFVQLHAKAASVRARALSVLRAAGAHAKSKALLSQPGMGLLELALGSKQVGFGKVMKMIDNMVANLKKEQLDDDAKKQYCNVQFDEADDKKKGLETSVSSSEAAIQDLEGSIATLKEEVESLKDGIKALDASVADATAQRKAEHDECTTTSADNNQAKKVLQWAKNRLNKFYSPKLYKAPPKRPLTEEQVFAQYTATPALVQLVESRLGKDAPPPPPETFGAYAKKGQETAGVISMIDLLVRDLDKQLQEAEVTEKDSQRDYEAAMAEAAKKRASDSKSVADKTSSAAAEGEMLLAEKDSKASASKELAMTLKYIQSLHGECDWLVKYYDVRKEARVGEVDSLGKAKAILNGADFSLVQTGGAEKRAGHLRSRR